jgi:hypothetical protein
MAAHCGLFGHASDVAAPGFFVFYNSIFGMFCPLWTGETELGGLRMVRRRAAE